MSGREMSDDDEKDLLDAEFESMVANLSLDQSAPTTYLDELDATPAVPEYANPPRVKFNIITAVKTWWHRRGRDGDGALL